MKTLSIAKRKKINKNKMFFKRTVILLCFVFVICFKTFSQSKSAIENLYDEKTLSFPVWVEAEFSPDLVAVDLKSADERLRQLSVELLELAVYGWEISYTPFDKGRNVKEFFSFEKLGQINQNDERIKFSKFQRTSTVVSTTVFYTMSPAQVRGFSRFDTAKIKTYSARGRANMSLGAEGMHKAVENSILESVRTYARSVEKNKPKEIIAQVRLVESPRLTIRSGDYVADLKIRLEVKEIIPYSVY